MKNLEEIKNEEAIKLGYQSFRDLLLNPKEGSKMQHTLWWVDACMEQYATERINQLFIDLDHKANGSR